MSVYKIVKYMSIKNKKVLQYYATSLYHFMYVYVTKWWPKCWSANEKLNMAGVNGIVQHSITHFSFLGVSVVTTA